MDTKVIATRLQKLESYVQHLHDLKHAALDEYLDDENLQAIVERRLQLSIQVCMDIASYLIAQLGLPSPEQPENVFAVLGRQRILLSALADRMVREMVRPLTDSAPNVLRLCPSKESRSQLHSRKTRMGRG